MDDFSEQYLAWAGVGTKMEFAIINGGVIINAPANFLVSKNLYFLESYFNSTIFDWFYRNNFTLLGERGIRFYVHDFLECPAPLVKENRRYTEEELMSFFQFTQEEINLISSSVNP